MWLGEWKLIKLYYNRTGLRNQLLQGLGDYSGNGCRPQTPQRAELHTDQAFNLYHSPSEGQQSPLDPFAVLFVDRLAFEKIFFDENTGAKDDEDGDQGERR